MGLHEQRRTDDPWAKEATAPYDCGPRQWPRRGKRGAPLTCPALVAVQAKAQKRLADISAGRDMTALLLELRRYRTPSQRFDYDAKSGEGGVIGDSRHE